MASEAPPIILIVEDEPLFEAFQKALATRQYTVLYAMDTAEALSLCETKMPLMVVVPLGPLSDALVGSWHGTHQVPGVVLGLVAPDAEISRTLPSGIARVARRGQHEETVSLANVLLREQEQPNGAAAEAGPSSEESPAEPAGEYRVAFDQAMKAGSSEPVSEEDSSEGGEEDDGERPSEAESASRAGDLRQLGLAMSVARATNPGLAEYDAGGDTNLRLSHARQEADARMKSANVSQTGPIKAISNLMKEMPAPVREEEPEDLSQEIRTARQDLQMKMAAADLLVEEAPEKAPKKKLKKLHLQHRRRRWPWVLLVLAVMVAGVGVPIYLWRTGRAWKKQPTGPKPLPIAAIRDDDPDLKVTRKHGVFEDRFAGTVAWTDETVSSLDADVTDEHLNKTVPELYLWGGKYLKYKTRRQDWMRALTHAKRHLDDREYKEALPFLNQALKIRDHKRIRMMFAETYIKLRKRHVAIYHLNKAVRLDRRNPALRYQLGTLYRRIRKRKLACQAFRAAARLDKEEKKYQKAARRACRKR